VAVIIIGRKPVPHKIEKKMIEWDGKEIEIKGGIKIKTVEIEAEVDQMRETMNRNGESTDTKIEGTAPTSIVNLSSAAVNPFICVSKTGMQIKIAIDSLQGIMQSTTGGVQASSLLLSLAITLAIMITVTAHQCK
jgi:hypothetical protein